MSEEIVKQIVEQGNEVRRLKGEKGTDEALIQEAIAKLTALKVAYKEATGEEYVSPNARQAKPKKEEKKKEPKPQAKKEDGKKVTLLGVGTKKDDNYSEWYTEVITKAEMIEYYDVSGCYVLRPWSYAVWESIQAWFDSGIKKLGVKNCYFPMFVSNSALEREKTHIADFAPEVAWVTRAGSSDLPEPIAIRPTSETVMYPSYKKWVQSHRDLPIKLNQWCNVVRWEFKHPTPFLRTREFLWQEGHTAFANPADAEEEVFQILDLYAGIYNKLLAIPVVKGRKSEKEKFAGGDFTTTVEAYVACNGRGIQGATSHHLGQNFSKMFDISYEDPACKEGQRAFAWQNSWGLSTRTIGAMVMIHGDDKGLVLPPRVAAVQVIVVPVGFKTDTKEKLFDAVDKVTKDLVAGGVKAEHDLRENYQAGWKFNHWELKGVPIRFEIGPNDLAKNQVTAVVRHSGDKKQLSLDGLSQSVLTLLDEIHDEMYNKALAQRDAHLKLTTDMEEFKKLLDDKCIILAPFCGHPNCEDEIKKASTREDGEGAQMGAKTLCIPLEQPKEALPSKCIFPVCTEKAKAFALFGRSY
ncbi:CBN-PARS-1 protein [Caenorhabditis brenneri]|uniref:proline--tRNA ligase n=1 Tax=Caenorhabditis brenneri TaxID=135651 RepID=G0MG90_CAEBE|nr:CBN-PARS-1 protein [Caenorhabditis brenneri]